MSAKEHIGIWQGHADTWQRAANRLENDSRLAPTEKDKRDLMLLSVFAIVIADSYMDQAISAAKAGGTE